MLSPSSPCPLPPIAQAYSLNITLVPSGFVDFVTLWPTGQPRPTASTLNGYVNTVIANAAIVPGGTSGSVDVYASQRLHRWTGLDAGVDPRAFLTGLFLEVFQARVDPNGNIAP
jgi:hypothetical protein